MKRTHENKIVLKNYDNDFFKAVPPPEGVLPPLPKNEEGERKC